MRQPHQPKDRNGRPVKVGDIVRIIGTPDLSRMSRRGRAASMPVFEYLVGTYRRIAAFDELGCARFEFAIRRGTLKGLHDVGIEPHLLHVPLRRSISEAKQKSHRRHPG